MSEQQRFIQYVGKNAKRPDNQCGTGIVWYGHGDIKPVPGWVADRLVQFDDWEEVSVDQVPMNKRPPANFNPNVQGLPADKHQAILKAIGFMDESDKQHFTTAGVPRVEAIEDILGYSITSRDRDAAWQTFQEARESLMSGDMNEHSEAL